MDGNIQDQVRLMRGIIGRKYMEIDDCEAKAAERTGEEAEKMMDMISFLKNDIAGYKTIIDDLKDGTNDLTGNIWDIASFTEKDLSLYTDVYLPGLNDDDRAEEDAAMEIKTQYAVDLSKAYIVHVGRMALTDPRVLDIMLADENIAAAIGSLVLDNEEITNLLNNQ